MSYWCGFEETDVDSINMTSNVAPMWRLAGADLAELNGKPAKEIRPILAKAVYNMLIDPAKYIALEPANGWGDYSHTVSYLAQLAIMCAAVSPDDLFYAHH